jgi:TolA-binding protein
MRKKYDVAISYYKKSAILNDKAAYMPTLLLHSAISFENIKDKENAKSFYGTLIELYPSSEEASTAKKNLSKLK